MPADPETVIQEQQHAQLDKAMKDMYDRRSKALTDARLHVDALPQVELLAPEIRLGLERETADWLLGARPAQPVIIKGKGTAGAGDHGL
jgi:hypothetical protein